MKLYVIRHCSAAGQSPEAPLTDAGRSEAEELADRLAAEGIQAIVSSPFLRARGSAEPLARRMGLPVQIDPRLKERVLSSGGLPDWRDALRRTFLDPDLTFPGGESSRTATERALAAVREVAAQELSVSAIVTHGNLLALILRTYDPAFGYLEWEALRNPDCYIITGSGAGASVMRAW